MHRIYITSAILDARGSNKKKQFEALGLKNKVGAVYISDSYIIDAKLDKKQLEKVKSLLANSLSQKAEINFPQTKKFSYAIEIGFLPGVTDNIGHTAKESVIDGAAAKFKPGQNVYSSQVFFINGDISPADAKKIAGSLYNPLIQHATITSFADFKEKGILPLILPKVKIKSSNKVGRVDLNVADDEIVKLGKLGIADISGRRGPLALSLEELKAIRDYFNSINRKPTDVELETLAQTWSEHCKHTIFSDPIDELKNGIYKTYIKAATETVRKQKGKQDFCVSVFSDNAGGIKFDNNNLIAYKVETHNTPSALDPFGGAITGIVGVNRDILGFGLGAKPVANFYGFCLADPNDKTKLYRDKNLEQPMLSARRIMDGVIAGVNAGGNQSGIPTPLGFLYFDPRFRGKPLVFAGTLGLIPKKIGEKKSWEKSAKPGDLIVTVGGKVGLDGIHGATFSSESLDTHSPAGAVQIGDPITQKKFGDAIVKEARGMNLYNSITDCGAGGLSSAVGEMAQQAGGCEVMLDKVPLKYSGLRPWQIWISESQERMVLSVPKNKLEKFQKLMKSRGIEAAAIGQFTNSGNCVIKYKNQTVLDIKLDFLHNGRPKKHLHTKPIKTRPAKQSEIRNSQSQILSLLSKPNITSTEFVSRQYDHEVQGSSVIKPLQGKGLVNSNAAVIRPVLTSKKGVVMSYGLHPEMSETNPYLMAATAIDSAIASAVAIGADVDNLALLDNFCWCSPEDPGRLWQLKEAARACYDYAVDFGTPFISGKDSMHNDFKGYGADGKKLKISIQPTLLITAVGVIPDIEKSVSLDAKLAGDVLYVLGSADSEKIDAHKNLKLYRSIFKANQQNLIASAISVNRGGIIIALAKSLIAGGLGAEVILPENEGRILASVDPKKSAEFEKLMGEDAFTKIGKVTAKPVLIIADKKNKPIVKLNIQEAQKSYKSTFKDF